MSLSGILAIVSSWIPTVIAALAANAVKVTLLLLLTGVAAFVLRKRSAAARHALWCAALVGALLLPVLTLAVPEWKLPVLPATRPAPVAAPAVVPAPIPASAPTAPIAPQQVHRHAPVAPRPAPLPEIAPAASVTPPAPPASPRTAPPLPSLPVMLLALWTLGSCLVLARVAIGHMTLLHLSRQGRPLRSAAWVSLAERAAEEAGLDRPFDLLECDRIGVPATFGIVRPVVLLPPAAREWPADRRSAVLVHELAHAARYDCLTQLLAQIACALYWYHPGVWWAERRMRVERESACDDRVLEGRMAASDYADHLIEVLREARRPGLPTFGAVAFARRSSLEGRLLALLDPLRDRRSPSRRIAWSAGLTTGALLLGLAGAQLGAAPAPSVKVTMPAVAAAAPSQGGEVLLAPDSEADLQNRWAWAVQGSARQTHGGMWIGYELGDVRAGGGHGLLSDSEGIDLALLNGHATGPTLHEVLARRGDFLAGSPAPDGVAILFHVTRNGAVDRVRTQSFSLAPPPGGQPLYWLGKAGDQQSLAWLHQLSARVSADGAKLGILDAASYHGDSESVNSWLGQVAQSDAKESVRATAAQGLARHPTPASLRVLDKLAREDRSAEVRKSAIEALGEVDDPAAASVLFDIARSHDDIDIRREAVESLGESATETAPGTDTESAPESPEFSYDFKMDVSGLEESAKALSEQAEAFAQTSECLKKTACTVEKCKEKTKVECAKQAKAVAEAAGATAEAIDDVDNDDSEIAVQIEAVDALGNLPEVQVLPRLVKIARTHSVPRVRREAVDTIGQFQSEQALSALDDLAWNAPDPMVQVEAVDSYGQAAPGQQLSRLTRIARMHPRPEVRREAVDQMSQLDPELVLPVLEGVVQSDKEIAVKIEAVDALGGLSNQAGMRSLERIAKSNLPARVRREAIEALGKDDPSAALPVIEEILQDKQPTP
jgi:beta-lactamase regulating signal transducer with metallopeptidase domain/HEAT repeat protein